jgi:hypothetical protein
MIYNTPGEHAKHYTTYAAKLMYMYYNNKSLPHIKFNNGGKIGLIYWCLIPYSTTFQLYGVSMLEEHMECCRSCGVMFSMLTWSVVDHVV